MAIEISNEKYVWTSVIIDLVRTFYLPRNNVSSLFFYSIKGIIKKNTHKHLMDYVPVAVGKDLSVSEFPL